MDYVLAVDIGASGGRHMLAHAENGKIVLEEIYRFENGMRERAGRKCWDLEALWAHLLRGMRACAGARKVPLSVGVDTWAVDYVLLDGENRPVGDAVAYRDGRTRGMPERLEARLPFAELYRRTGIARQPFNTIYQLMATPPEELDLARDFLMIPDYLHWRLTGVKINEYTNASTTALLNAETRDWDGEVLETAGIPRRLFHTPVQPGTNLGKLQAKVAKRVGFSCEVFLPATHDTGSAFLAVPAEDDRAVYLSSGTWSLLGVENARPLTGEDSLRSGFTNEGGYGGRIRYLKNIMGMWMLQCIRREIGTSLSFTEMADMAAQAPEVPWRVDTADNRFLAPESMLAELAAAVRGQGGGELSLPETLRVVHRSLAEDYAAVIRQLEALTGRPFNRIHMVGGGSRNETLNQMAADASGRPVFAGPTEGTALGNAMAQLIAAGIFRDIAEARAAERRSFEGKIYTPGGRAKF